MGSQKGNDRPTNSFLFTLLLLILQSILVDTASGDQAPAPETELASEILWPVTDALAEGQQ